MARRYLCGTPPANCTGATFIANAGLGKSQKGHTTSVEAFHCYRRWLLAQGYEQTGSREFRKEGVEGVLVLEKPSKFGGELRLGKMGRFEPKDGGGIIF
jgi:hypothetical protein